MKILAEDERLRRQHHANKYFATELYSRFIYYATRKIKQYGLEHRKGSLNTDGAAYVSEAYMAYINGRNLPEMNTYLDIAMQEEDQWKRYMYDAIGSRIKDENRKVSKLGNNEIEMTDGIEDPKSQAWDDDPHRHLESLENMTQLLGDPETLSGQFLRIFINNKEYTNEWAATELSISVSKIKQLKRYLKGKIERSLDESLNRTEEPNICPRPKSRAKSEHVSE